MNISKRAILKALILFFFIMSAVFVAHFTGVKDVLTPKTMARFLDAYGFWAPFLFILIHAASICLFVPASIPTIIGAGLFGAYWGFVYVWIGDIIGASGAFVIGRTLGRDFVASIVRDKLKKYDAAIEKNGFVTVFYLRLLNVPFTPLNFGMGMTGVHFRDYFFGTSLGVVVGIFVVTFVGGVLKDVWVSGNWGGLISFKVFFSVALFIFSFFIPTIIKKIKWPALLSNRLDNT